MATKKLGRDEALTPARGWLHQTYFLSLFFKGLLGASQLFAGLGLLLFPGNAIIAMSDWLRRNELAQDPTDPVARWLADVLAHTPAQADAFYALYLTGHGVLNLGLVLALLAGWRWAFPASIVALVGFVVFQMGTYAHSGGALLLVLSAVDVFVIWLIWREYQHLPSRSHS